MSAFRGSWEEAVRLLTLAVDSVISVDDFLAVSEAHIVEDVKACIEAVVQKVCLHIPQVTLLLREMWHRTGTRWTGRRVRSGAAHCGCARWWRGTWTSAPGTPTRRRSAMPSGSSAKMVRPVNLFHPTVSDSFIVRGVL